MQVLGQGISVHRDGECLQKTENCTMEIRLLESWDGTEITHIRVRAGGIFSLLPSEGAGLEYIYILSGRLVFGQAGTQFEFGPGDRIAGKPVMEGCTFKALDEVTLLYVTSQRVWHLVHAMATKQRRMAVAVEEKDGYTSEHCQRLERLSFEVGIAMGLSSDRLPILTNGAFLHDIGKVEIPDYILGKPGPLTAEEWVIMKQHPLIGRDLVLRSAVPEAAVVVAQHHERLDGSGYPHGLKGDEISLEAQIVAVIDSYDAMTTDRVYRPARSQAEALAELRRCAGTLYRPDVVEAFVRVVTTEKSATPSRKPHEAVTGGGGSGEARPAAGD